MIDQTFSALSKELEGDGIAILPMPAELLGDYENTKLSAATKEALRNIIHLPFNTDPQDAIGAFDIALEALTADEFDIADETGRAAKFDTFDAYFSISRTQTDPGRAYIYGLLASFRNVYAMLDPEGTLSVTELPLLRMALESSLEIFDLTE
ncbi:MAG: hypothetical protein AB8G95_01475 [Anaerolineae bacterium]